MVPAATDVLGATVPSVLPSLRATAIAWAAPAVKIATTISTLGGMQIVLMAGSREVVGEVAQIKCRKRSSAAKRPSLCSVLIRAIPIMANKIIFTSTMDQRSMQMGRGSMAVGH